MNELIINGQDAFKIWGVKMGDKFLDTLNAPIPMKEYVVNKSRLEHGKRVITSKPQMDSREIILAFTIEGKSKSDFKNKREAFLEQLYKGQITVQVPDDSSNIYHLLYLGKSVTYSQSFDRTFCKLSAKFEELNPSNRS